MNNYISSFNEHFFYYKNMIINFPHITDKKYINNNFELISIQKNFNSEIEYLFNTLSIEQLKQQIITNSICILNNYLFLTKNKYPYK